VPVGKATHLDGIVMRRRAGRARRNLAAMLRLCGMPHVNPTDDALREILTTSHTIAVVGASSDPDRASYSVMKVLMAAGFNVIPVTPREPRILGRTSYPTLADVPEHVDIVDVFRRAEDTPAIADEAVKIGAKVLWLQLGITNDEAATREEAGGLTAVMDLCIGKTTLRFGIKRPPR